MKRRAWLAAAALCTIALAPAAQAHQPWDVYDTCNTTGNIYFYPGGPSQWWKIHTGASLATGGCHLYTTNAQTQMYNYADWYLPTQSCAGALPATGGHDDGRCDDEKAYTGTYQILIHIARESHFSTRRAPYLRYAYSQARGVQQSVRIDQAAAAQGNKFVLQGYFDTRVDYGYSGFMRVTDYTGEASQTKFVGVDRLYFHPVH